MAIQRNNYTSTPAGPYSVAVRHNDSLYISGLTAFGTPAQGQSMAEQAEATLAQIQQIAQAEGVSLRNLVKVTVFLTRMDDIGAVRAVLYKHYDGAFPASSMVQVAALFSPDLTIEMEAVLALD